MFSTTEITSHEISSDNVIHQRLLYAYVKAAEMISGNVLELGCGAGRGMELIAQAADNYTGIDKNSKLLASHQKQYPNFTFLEQNIPPFRGIEDNTFDFVITFQVIEHIEDDGLFVKEIHRVLKPGGKAIITTPNIELSLTRNPWHVREYTAKQLHTLLAKYFEQVALYGIFGNNAVNEYYERNRASVQKITRFDIFNLQYRLPRRLLQVPYDILNRMNRKKLQKVGSDLVSQVTVDDYNMNEQAEQGFDFFAVVTK
ncbi:MAG: class I SAM-dependent methyltransferase [Flammeovirgaceae bacterium]